MNAISCTPIGVIRSPCTEPVGMPIQSVPTKGVAEMIELDLQISCKKTGRQKHSLPSYRRKAV